MFCATPDSLSIQMEHHFALEYRRPRVVRLFTASMSRRFNEAAARLGKRQPIDNPPA
jgi:hypothetical protein